MKIEEGRRALTEVKMKGERKKNPSWLFSFSQYNETA
jgi:hypothetical protein